MKGCQKEEKFFLGKPSLILTNQQYSNQRLKLMACDMIESSIQRWSFIQNDNFYIMYAIFRTYASFENKLKSGINLNPTDYILPNEVKDIFVPDADASN